MFPGHIALYQFVNLFQNNLAIEHSSNKWRGVAFDQCHAGNNNNQVAVSFSSCTYTEFYLYTKYYELFYIKTRIILLHL